MLLDEDAYGCVGSYILPKTQRRIWRIPDKGRSGCRKMACAVGCSGPKSFLAVARERHFVAEWLASGRGETSPKSQRSDVPVETYLRANYAQRTQAQLEGGKRMAPRKEGAKYSPTPGARKTRANKGEERWPTNTKPIT